MYRTYQQRIDREKGCRVYAAPIGPVKPSIPEGMLMLLPDERMAAIQLTAVMASRYGVTPRQILSRQQSMIVRRARAETIRVVHEAMGWPADETAAFFGLDRTTIVHHVSGGRA